MMPETIHLVLFSTFKLYTYFCLRKALSKFGVRIFQFMLRAILMLQPQSKMVTKNNSIPVFFHLEFRYFLEKPFFFTCYRLILEYL